MQKTANGHETDVKGAPRVSIGVGVDHVAARAGAERFTATAIGVTRRTAAVRSQERRREGPASRRCRHPVGPSRPTSGLDLALTPLRIGPPPGRPRSWRYERYSIELVAARGRSMWWYAAPLSATDRRTHKADRDRPGGLSFHVGCPLNLEIPATIRASTPHEASG